MNRHVIAFNHRLIKHDWKLSKHKPSKNGQGIKALNELMDFVRKYPENKIQDTKLYSCGFSKN